MIRQFGALTSALLISLPLLTSASAEASCRVPNAGEPISFSVNPQQEMPTNYHNGYIEPNLIPVPAGLRSQIPFENFLLVDGRYYGGPECRRQEKQIPDLRQLGGNTPWTNCYAVIAYHTTTRECFQVIGPTFRAASMGSSTRWADLSENERQQVAGYLKTLTPSESESKPPQQDTPYTPEQIQAAVESLEGTDPTDHQYAHATPSSRPESESEEEAALADMPLPEPTIKMAQSEGQVENNAQATVDVSPIDPETGQRINTGPSAADRSFAGMTQEQKDAAMQSAKNRLHEEVGNDPCAYSNRLEGNYDCSGSQKAIQYSEYARTGTQVAGGFAAQAIGQSANQSAMQSGTNSGALNASASATERTGKMQMTIGALHSALSMPQFTNARRHKSNEQPVQEAKSATFQRQNGQLRSTSETANEIVDEFNLHGEAQPVAEGTARHIAGHVKREQQKVKNDSNQGGFMSLMAGIQGLVGGYQAVKTAKEMRAAADAMRGVEARLPTFDPGDMDGGNPYQPRPPHGVTGDGIDDPAYGEYDPGDAPQFPEKPFGTTPEPKLDGNFLQPGHNQADGGGAGGPGGGGGGLGGGGSIGKPGGTEGEGEGARYAASVKNPKSYYGGGGRRERGAPAGGGGGMEMPDLGKMLAQFFPEDTKKEPSKSILDYGYREPAGQPVNSLLDRGADIFERISRTYQDKHQRGYLGEK